MTTPTEAATLLYERLKPEALNAARTYIMTRTPHDLQEEMATLIDDDLNPPPDPTVAFIHDGGSVVVVDNLGAPVAGSPATAAVADGELTNVKLGAV